MHTSKPGLVSALKCGVGLETFKPARIVTRVACSAMCVFRTGSTVSCT
jgi:hypothetical protein